MGDLPMKLTLVVTDSPTESWTAMFTTNAFPGAPIKVGRRRLTEKTALQAVLVNNKVSNVCAAGGVEVSEHLCECVATELNLEGGASAVVPCSTGVIGWGLPVKEMVEALPTIELQRDSALPAAEAIMTTDRYPKIRSSDVRGGGRITGFAKGAGMIEPHLATMLVYVLTDVEIDRADLHECLQRAVDSSFNCLSIDSDESTSDTVLAVSSNYVPRGTAAQENHAEFLTDFEAALTEVCQELADDVVRNGEGTSHVIEVSVSGAPDDLTAREVARTMVNSPLTKCAVAGNDPNVGRLVAAAGKYLGLHTPDPTTVGSRMSMRIGGHLIFANGEFCDLSADMEVKLVAHMRAAELGEDCDFPKHKNRVEVHVDLGSGEGKAVFLGSDLTHEYVSINADYRS